MGFSIGIASFIVLIGFMAIFSAVCTAFFVSVQELSYATNEYISDQKDKIDTQMQLTVDLVTVNRTDVTIKNVGSKTIFLQNSNGYSWNTVILTYGNDTEWHSYTIESYTVTEIRITGTNTTLNIATHNFINPGEQVSISLYLPSGAPEISSEDLVSVTFASHYGTTASSEGVMA